MPTERQIGVPQTVPGGRYQGLANSLVAGQAGPTLKPGMPQGQGGSLYEQGLRHYLQGNKAQALQFWQAALKQDPGNQEAMNGINRIQPPAPQVINQDSQAFYEGGLKSYLGGDTQGASDFWQKALQADRNNREAQNGMRRVKARGR